jgi:hypothetical protein
MASSQSKKIAKDRVGKIREVPGKNSSGKDSKKANSMQDVFLFL